MPNIPRTCSSGTLSTVICQTTRPNLILNSGFRSVSRSCPSRRFSSSQSNWSSSSSSSSFSSETTNYHLKSPINKMPTTSTSTSTDSNSQPCDPPPPRIPYYNDTKEKVYHHGRCFCGKVKFTIHRPKPLGSKYCHCKTCQRLHGAVFQWATIFAKSSIAFTTGQQHLRFLYHNGDEGDICEWAYKLPCKVSASCCGTPLMDEGRNMLMMFPAIIDLSDEQRLAWRTEPGEGGQRPCHIFYKSRCLDVKDGLRKFAGLDEHSELMEEEDIDGMSREEKKQQLAKYMNEQERN